MNQKDIEKTIKVIALLRSFKVKNDAILNQIQKTKYAIDQLENCMKDLAEILKDDSE